MGFQDIGRAIRILAGAEPRNSAEEYLHMLKHTARDPLHSTETELSPESWNDAVKGPGPDVQSTPQFHIHVLGIVDKALQRLEKSLGWTHRDFAFPFEHDERVRIVRSQQLKYFDLAVLSAAALGDLNQGGGVGDDVSKDALLRLGKIVERSRACAAYEEQSQFLVAAFTAGKVEGEMRTHILDAVELHMPRDFREAHDTLTRLLADLRRPGTPDLSKVNGPSVAGL